MSEKNKKAKISAFGVFRLILLVVVICCAVYVIRWFYVGYSTKKHDKDIAEKYTHPIENTVQDEVLPEEPVTGSEENEKPKSNYNMYVDFEALRQEGEDVVAWIKVPCFDVIDYPVVWRDDFYYLKRDWTGQSSSHGSIFLEEMNRTDFLDLHTIIYGHNMRDDTMFGPLEKYESEEFYRENGGTVIVYTPDATYTYEIFSVEDCSNYDEGIYTVGFIKDDVYARFLRGMKDRSLYDTGVDVTVDDRVLTLSTCTYDYYGSRFVVHAKLVATE